MPSHVLRRALLPSLGVLAALAVFDARAAFAAKIKMVFPGPVTCKGGTQRTTDA